MGVSLLPGPVWTMILIYPSPVPGITGVYKCYTWLAGWDVVSITFCPDWLWIMIFWPPKWRDYRHESLCLAQHIHSYSFRKIRKYLLFKLLNEWYLYFRDKEIHFLIYLFYWLSKRTWSKAKYGGPHLSTQVLGRLSQENVSSRPEQPILWDHVSKTTKQNKNPNTRDRSNLGLLFSFIMLAELSVKLQRQ
jgi:hypothetical protein